MLHPQLADCDSRDMFSLFNMALTCQHPLLPWQQGTTMATEGLSQNLCKYIKKKNWDWFGTHTNREKVRQRGCVCVCVCVCVGGGGASPPPLLFPSLFSLSTCVWEKHPPS